MNTVEVGLVFVSRAEFHFTENLGFLDFLRLLWRGMVPVKGIEPSTFSLRMSCSTD